MKKRLIKIELSFWFITKANLITFEILVADKLTITLKPS